MLAKKKIISPDTKPLDTTTGTAASEPTPEAPIEPAKKPVSVNGGNASNQYAAVEHHNQVEDGPSDELGDIGNKADYTLNIKEKTGTAFHFSLSTLILLAVLVLSVLGGVMVAFKSSDVASEDQQAVANVESIPVPQTSQEIPEETLVVTEDGQQVVENSNKGEEQELLELSFTVEESATLFFFNKMQTYTFEWTGNTDEASFGFMHLIADTGADPDFFADTSITEVVNADEGTLVFEIPPSMEGSVNAKLCGFNSDTRSCAVVSNIVKIRE